jgi:succinate dehydrogenase / fumarate reductase cytochrome b subunit
MSHAHLYPLPQARPGSTIGRKALMAISGLLLLAWCALHVVGNLLTLLGPDVVNGYGAALHDSPVLWLQRIGLLAITLVHVLTAITLSRRNRCATGSHRPTRLSAAGTMPLTGAALLGLTAVHVATIYGVGHPAFLHGDVHHNLFTLARTPSGAATLLGLTALIGLHVGHGAKSALVSIGLTAGPWPRPLSRAVEAVPSLFVIGFALPVAWAWLSGVQQTS